MNLYRFLAEVRAGEGQTGAAPGEFGLVTLWVRANSQPSACAQAELILATKRYASVGRLSSYVEHLADDPLPGSSEEERAVDRRDDWLASKYDVIKEEALARGDGLHEVWLGGIGHHLADRSIQSAIG